MKSIQFQIAAYACTLIACAGTTSASASVLGSAGEFAVLGASTVTNTGTTTVTGDIGVYPGTAITGLGSIVHNGQVHAADGVAQSAQTDASLAFESLRSMASTLNLSGQNLGGRTLNPGVYRFDSSAELAGVLNLDALGDPNAMFVFQIGSAFTTASSSIINVLNAGGNTGIFFQVGTSATLGSSSVFAGNILADQSVTFGTSAMLLCGRALALNAAVTMDSNTVANDCTNVAGQTDYGSFGYSGGRDRVEVPEPATFGMMGLGVLGMLAVRRRNKAVVA
ncbi:MAG TPA: DUF3494 domain-containing protein [Telluria sp.]